MIRGRLTLESYISTLEGFLLVYYTLLHALDENVPHWRRSRRFQTIDLEFHCIF
jgi:hypothetical protein